MLPDAEQEGYRHVANLLLFELHTSRLDRCALFYTYAKKSFFDIAQTDTGSEGSCGANSGPMNSEQLPTSPTDRRPGPKDRDTSVTTMAQFVEVDGDSSNADGTINVMSVDVEDYFHVSAFERHISRDDWDRLPCRIERNMDRVLGLFARHGVQATFFVLGWVAAKYPNVVRDIVANGHELASHGYSHVRTFHQTPNEFRSDVARTKRLLEDISGHPVLGYRAPTYSIGSKTLWTVDILKEVGYRYSSSVYPIHHDLYGMPEAPRFAFRYQQDGLLEIPISTTHLFGINLPCGGGGYFRLLPYALSRWALRRVNVVDNRPCVFYFHPWEIDPKQPRQTAANIKSRVRHYLNLRRMEARLDRLLRDFRWGRIDCVFLGASEPPR